MLEEKFILILVIFYDSLLTRIMNALPEKYEKKSKDEKNVT